MNKMKMFMNNRLVLYTTISIKKYQTIYDESRIRMTAIGNVASKYLSCIFNPAFPPVVAAPVSVLWI